jgi:hypothetical protein
MIKHELARSRSRVDRQLAMGLARSTVSRVHGRGLPIPLVVSIYVNNQLC